MKFLKRSLMEINLCWFARVRTKIQIQVIIQAVFNDCLCALHERKPVIYEALLDSKVHFFDIDIILLL